MGSSIKWVHQELHETEAGFFTTGEHADFLVYIGTTEQEGSENGAGFVLAHVTAAGHDFLDDGVCLVHGLRAVLGEVSQLGVVATVTLATFELKFSSEDF